MKYALVYDVNGRATYYGFTESMDLEQLSTLCQNAIADGIEIFQIEIFGGETVWEVKYRVSVDTSAVDDLEKKVDRINEKLKEAKTLAGEIASLAEMDCLITIEPD